MIEDLTAEEQEIANLLKGKSRMEIDQILYELSLEEDHEAN